MQAEFVDTKVGPGRVFVPRVLDFTQPLPLKTDMHQSFEIGVVLAGQVVRYFEDLVLPQGPGDVWLHGSWEPHEWRVVVPNTRVIAFHFLPEYLGEQAHDGPNWLALFASRPRDRPHATTAMRREVILTIARELEQEVQEKSRGWEISVRLGLLRLLHILSRNWEPRGQLIRQQAIRLSDLSRVMPAINMLGAGPIRRVSLDQAAAKCGLSVSQFRAVFLRTVGMSFGKFCLRARLAHVAHKLLTTDLPLEELAEEADFTDASHLHRAFVSKYGYTPVQYRHEGSQVRLGHHERTPD